MNIKRHVLMAKAKTDTAAGAGGATTAVETKPAAGAAPAPATATTGTEVATTAQNTSVALMQDRFLADTETNNTGFEEANGDAYAIPFVQILQSGSPQCKRSEGEYIAGAVEGMFLNTVTKELFGAEYENPPGTFVRDPIRLVPCHYSQRFIEWKPRDSGGGFVAEHMPDDPCVLQTTKDEDNRDVLPNGNVLVDTRNHYVLLLKADGGFEAAVITMSSTQLKKSRNWMSKMQGIKIKQGTKFVTAPMAAHIYKATTIPESNDKGSWMGWKIELEGPVADPEIYDAAQSFRHAVVAGRAKAKQPDAQAGDGADVAY